MIRAGRGWRSFTGLGAKPLCLILPHQIQQLGADGIVSKQDTHFINVFSMVIALLVAIAIALFALARVVASQTQDKQIFTEADYYKNVEERVRPFARVAVAGKDNSALAVQAPASAAPAGGAATGQLPKSGEEVFQQTCSVCHGQGIGGAPKAGDKAAWAPRMAKGKDALYQHALQGFQDSSGFMPPKGGRTDIADDLVKQAVDHMIQMAQ